MRRYPLQTLLRLRAHRTEAARMDDLYRRWTGSLAPEGPGLMAYLGGAAEVLEGLGFTTADLHRPYNEFSGGWRMRVLLAKMMLQAPDVLVLAAVLGLLVLAGVVGVLPWRHYLLGVFVASFAMFLLSRHLIDLFWPGTGSVDSGLVQWTPGLETHVLLCLNLALLGLGMGAVLVGLGALLMLAYPLTEERFSEIVVELRSRRLGPGT